LGTVAIRWSAIAWAGKYWGSAFGFGCSITAREMRPKKQSEGELQRLFECNDVIENQGKGFMQQTSHCEHSKIFWGVAALHGVLL
jgi:hypothetical protein